MANRGFPGTPIVCERCRQLFTISEPVPSQAAFPQHYQPTEYQPGNPFAQSPTPSRGNGTVTTLLVVGSLVGVLMLVVCGGLVWIAMTARSRIIAKAKEIEQIQKQRQLELQREMQPPPPVRTEPRKRPDNSPAKTSLAKASPVKTSPSTKPRDPNSRPTTGTSSSAAKNKERPRPPRPTTSSTTSLDDLLAELGDNAPRRPAWATLNAIERLPVQDDRKTEVSAAIDRHLRSDDSATAVAAAKAAKVWGTDWNLEALKKMVGSSHVSPRWEAIRTLAKISPTAETADILAEAAKEFSNIGALRDAMKDLGPVGETALLKQLEKGDRNSQQSLLLVLGECGTRSSLPKLQQWSDRNADPAVKGMARHAIMQIERRNP
jgi:hypothetical protein